MNVVVLLEQLAQNTHHQDKIKMLIDAQPDEVKKTILNHDVEGLKKQISNEKFYANSVQVVQI